jgi:hypothetical protein
MAVEPSSLAAVASVVAEAMLAVDVARLSDPVLVADRVATIVAEVLVERVVAALAGRTTTSQPATEMPVSPSVLTGSCLRRLTSTVWLS